MSAILVNTYIISLLFTHGMTALVPSGVSLNNHLHKLPWYTPGRLLQIQNHANNIHNIFLSSSGDYGIDDTTEEAYRGESIVEKSSSEWDENYSRGKIPVRFVNYEIMGSEKLVYAEHGTNVLTISDEAGVHIPRQCRSGLCGTCTADVKDPTWTEGDRIGFQTVRTCQAGAMLTSGCDEMVIDCYRNANSESSIQGDKEDAVLIGGNNVMSNFADGWEEEFQPDYKSSGGIEVMKNTNPEYTVKEGQKSTIEIEKPHWTPRIDANIPPWETVW